MNVRRRVWTRSLAALLLTGASVQASAPALFVSEGRITPMAGRHRIDAPAVRAVTGRGSSYASAELRFVYRGRTQTTKALGSGRVRTQVGLKLAADDPCNLLYVMWRIEPVNELVVSIKENPAKRTSAECGNAGYRNLTAETHLPLPAVTTGSEHVLVAMLTPGRVDVHVDGAPVWGGTAPAKFTRRGPVGLRTDNAAIDFSFQAGTELVTLVEDRPTEAPE